MILFISAMSLIQWKIHVLKRRDPFSGIFTYISAKIKKLALETHLFGPRFLRNKCQLILRNQYSSLYGNRTLVTVFTNSRIIIKTSLQHAIINNKVT